MYLLVSTALICSSLHFGGCVCIFTCMSFCYFPNFKVVYCGFHTNMCPQLDYLPSQHKKYPLSLCCLLQLLVNVSIMENASCPKWKERVGLSVWEVEATFTCVKHG